MRAKARLLFVDDQNKTLWFYTEVLYFQQRADLQIEKVVWPQSSYLPNRVAPSHSWTETRFPPLKRSGLRSLRRVRQ